MQAGARAEHVDGGAHIERRHELERLRLVLSGEPDVRVEHVRRALRAVRDGIAGVFQPRAAVCLGHVGAERPQPDQALPRGLADVADPPLLVRVVHHLGQPRREREQALPRHGHGVVQEGSERERRGATAAGGAAAAAAARGRRGGGDRGSHLSPASPSFSSFLL